MRVQVLDGKIRCGIKGIGHIGEHDEQIILVKSSRSLNLPTKDVTVFSVVRVNIVISAYDGKSVIDTEERRSLDIISLV